MFAAGDLVVYGGEGVCRVEGVGAPSLPGMDKTRLYYTLSPLYRSGQVMTPVDTQVLMRPLLTAEETAEREALRREYIDAHKQSLVRHLEPQHAGHQGPVSPGADLLRLSAAGGPHQGRVPAAQLGRSSRTEDKPDGRALSEAGGGRPVRGAGRGAGPAPGRGPGVHPENLAQMAVILTRRSSDGPALPAGPFLCAETIRRRTESRFSA